MKKKKNRQLSGQSMLYIAMAFFAVLVIIAVVQSRAEIRAKRQQLEDIKQQCQEQQIENDALSDLLNNSDSEYIERKAREELDYVLPGERVYIVRYGN